MATPKVKPPAVVFGALFNFRNYDLWPPSLRLVNPFTRVPYTAAELPTPLPRRAGGQPQPAPEAPLGSQPAAVQVVVQSIMQAYKPEDIPFACLPGVREYHQNPAHTGDSWLLRRGSGEGGLIFLLEQLHKYGVEPLVGFQVTILIKEAVLVQQDVPA
jgi:hypothetical protein